MSQSNKKKNLFITQSELIKKYGISLTLINKYFPEPQLKRNPHYRNAAPMKCWSPDQLKKAMSHPATKAAVNKKKEKIKKEQQASKKIQDYLLSFGIDRLIDTAKSLNREFVLHIGPTNSGKTHDALQDLYRAKSGMYLGPLRLLALEMFDRLNTKNCPCNLITGEEFVETKGALHSSSTIEICDYDTRYDVVVIDEAQLIIDPFRGDKWVKAIYCVDAAIVEICLAPEAETLITNIINSFDGKYTIIRHERLAPLKYAGPFAKINQVEPGDALVVFSRKAVLAVSAELSQLGISSSVIYGALPPASRKEEVRRFANKETSVVVATDAIGMGISLPIKRIIFCETKKYDGKHTRNLSSSEIKQIAGRAGRFGIYNKGEVLSMSDNQIIKDALKLPEEQIKEITLPFPEEAIVSDIPLDVLMSEWDNLPNPTGFKRANMSECIVLFNEIKPITKKMDRRLLFDLITCPVDIKNDKCLFYWRSCCFCIYHNETLPEPFCDTDSLEECENRYKQLDIRHQLLRRIGIEEDRMDEKLELCEKINEFLKQDKEKYLKRCSVCHKILPSTSTFGMCDDCYHNIFF